MTQAENCQPRLREVQNLPLSVLTSLSTALVLQAACAGDYQGSWTHPPWMRVQTDRGESILLLLCPPASEADLQEAKPWWGSKALTAGVLGCRGAGFPALLLDPALAAQLPCTLGRIPALPTIPELQGTR